MRNYILLFRGINVGGNNLLPMNELKALLKPEYGDVETYIQTGNLALQSIEDPTQTVKTKVNENFGFEPTVLALSESELECAIESNPYSEHEGKTVHFYFCEEKPNPNMEELTKLVDNGEQIELIGKVFYLHAPNGIGRSKLASKAEKLLGVATTTRNQNTVLKVQTMIAKFSAKQSIR